MFGTARYAAIIDSFANQFKPEGGHSFLFRRNQKGAAFQVTQEERDTFVAGFERAIKRMQILTLLSCVIFAVPLAFARIKLGEAFETPVIFAYILLVMLPPLALMYWAWDAPTRSLSGRAQKIQALTQDEARRLGFSKITYPRLAIGFCIGVGLVLVRTGGDVLHGSSPYYALFGGGLALFALIQTYRKWRFERADRSNSSIVSR